VSTLSALGDDRLTDLFSYYSITWFFLIGAVLPIPFYYLARRNPRSFWRYVNIPIVMNTVNEVPPLNGMNVISYTLIGFFFQFFMRRYHFRWWMRYNYLLSSGLDAGVVAALVIIFFTVQFPKGGFTVKWWGNTVWQHTADSNMIPLKTVPPGQIFGPTTWT
jgi:OPT oligopeptide transporter protein